MTVSAQSQQQVSIAEIQQPEGASDASPYAGTNVTTEGTVTAVTAQGFFIQNGTGQYSGLYVYTGNQPDRSPGDVVTVTAPVEEYFNLTELDLTATGASVNQTATAPVPEPTELATDSVGQEEYEGVLVAVDNLTVTTMPGQYGEWAVDDGTGEIAIDDVSAGDAATPNETGATIDSIVGPVFYSFDAFKIQPKTITPIQSPSDGSSGDDPVGDGQTLTVLTYNDIQTAASNPTAMGRLTGAITERRAAHDNPTVVIGGGDQVSPSSLSPISNWTVPVDVLNVFDPAAEVVGNHDLDYGFGAVQNFSYASTFPWLLANVVRDDGSTLPGTQNYTIVERGNVSIGVIGLVDGAIEGKTAVDFDANGYSVADYSSVGSRIATELKNEHDVDVVIAAAHIGVGDSQELARETQHIDVIVTGDDEVAYEPQVTSDTVIMEAEGRAAYLGELNLTVGDNDTSMASGRLIPVAGNGDIPVNETAETIVANARGTYLSEVVGRTEVPLDSTFAANYHDETAWGNLITDAFRWTTGAEVAITNAGGIRGNFVIEPGNVTYDDVYTSLPFGNTLVTKELNGTELVSLLESQVVTLESDEGQQFGEEASLQVSGITYEFVPHQGAAPIVRDVFVGGESLRMNATYNVTVNSYMASWDDMADDPTVSRNLTLYGTAVANYIDAQGTVAPADTNRIRRVDREVGAEWLFDRGRVSVPLHYEVPEEVRAINASTFHIANATTGVVTAEMVDLRDDDLLLRFDTSAFQELAHDSVSLQVYGEYNDSEYASQLVYFDRTILNGHLENWMPSDREDGVSEDCERGPPDHAPGADRGRGPPGDCEDSDEQDEDSDADEGESDRGPP